MYNRILTGCLYHTRTGLFWGLPVEYHPDSRGSRNTPWRTVIPFPLSLFSSPTESTKFLDCCDVDVEFSNIFCFEGPPPGVQSPLEIWGREPQVQLPLFFCSRRTFGKSTRRWEVLPRLHDPPPLRAIPRPPPADRAMLLAFKASDSTVVLMITYPALYLASDSCVDDSLPSRSCSPRF